MSLKRLYNGIPTGEIKQFLEEKYLQYNNPAFIICDPISIPHSFTDRRDREISDILTAAIDWSRRDLILRSSRYMLESPLVHSPLLGAGLASIKYFHLLIFDLIFECLSLKNWYSSISLL